MSKYFNKYQEGEILEIILKDLSGAKLDSFKCNKSDSKKFYQIISILKNKYGYGQGDDSDLDWLK